MYKICSKWRSISAHAHAALKVVRSLHVTFSICILHVVVWNWLKFEACEAHNMFCLMFCTSLWCLLMCLIFCMLKEMTVIVGTFSWSSFCSSITYVPYLITPRLSCLVNYVWMFLISCVELLTPYIAVSCLR